MNYNLIFPAYGTKQAVDNPRFVPELLQPKNQISNSFIPMEIHAERDPDQLGQ